MSQDVVTCPMCSKHCITGTLAYKTCELLTAQGVVPDVIDLEPLKDEPETT